MLLARTTSADNPLHRLGRVELRTALLAALLTQVACSTAFCDDHDAVKLQLTLTVTSPLEYANTPLDPTIDFTAWIRSAGVKGRLDPNSIQVVNRATGEVVPHARSEDFAYSDKGRVEFVVADPRHKRYQVRFRAVQGERPPLVPQSFTPSIGVGDLLRYNAASPRPVNLFHSMGLHDIDADGQADLVGGWNYYYRPGAPTGGLVFYPSVAKSSTWRFGDLQRIRYRRPGDAEATDFSHHYNAAAFADFNRDGRVDLLYARSGAKAAQFFLATERRAASGAYEFAPGGTIPVSGFSPCRAVDLNGDGAIDLVVGGKYIRNRGSGWPFEPAAPIALNAGKGACFLDLDGDKRPDSVCLAADGELLGGRAVWRRNLGGDPPKFAEPQSIVGLDREHVTALESAIVAARRLLLVQTAFQEIHIFEQTATEPPTVRQIGRAESVSAVMSLSDQAWPCLCDWDEDGDMDLLIGDGYGWPRIVINTGQRTRPVWAAPKKINAAAGQNEPPRPIRLVRNQLLGPPDNWHNMGYSYPDFVDWDGDGRRDLMLPNETNRIYWHRNLGSKGKPQFGPRRQLTCDGYPDSPELRSQSQRRANARDSNNGVYPLEKERPFFWRTGVAFADFNSDGLMDLVTLDGLQRQATLFSQYVDARKRRRLRRGPVLRLKDGRAIDDRIVERGKHWGESFRAIDWDDDGLIDLIYAVAGSHHGTKDNGSIYLLRNVGTASNPVFANPETMRCFGQPIKITNHGPHPWPGDYDDDGKPDLIACVEWSVYPFYSHAALSMPGRPTVRITLAEER